LLGNYPGNAGEPPRALPAIPGQIPGGLPADLIARRPDLAAAERRLAAADQRWVSAKRSLYPRLALTGSAGTTSAEFADLLDGNFGVWSLVAGLTQPLFQGGRLRAGVDAAEAYRVEAIETYAAAALRAYAEVESALAADRFLAAQTGHLEESVTQSTRAFTLAEERYEQGLEEYITVLDSRRSQLNAETALLTARRARLENRVGLYLALGGGFVRPDRDGDDDGTADDLASNRTEPTTPTER
jgi:outer membrane protein TolC